MEPHSRRASSHEKAETQLRVIVMDPTWCRFVPRAVALVSRAARLAGAPAPDGVSRNGISPGGISIVLADDRLVRGLNNRHRGRNKPTNVLTYEQPAEILLGLGVVRREAQAAGKPVAAHLIHLLIHGALHLQGHDHHHVGDARRMEAEEARLLARLGVANPWKNR